MHRELRPFAPLTSLTAVARQPGRYASLRSSVLSALKTTAHPRVAPRGGTNVRHRAGRGGDVSQARRQQLRRLKDGEKLLGRAEMPFDEVRSPSWKLVSN